MTEASIEVRVRAAHWLAEVLWAQAFVAAAGVPAAIWSGHAGLALLYGGLAAFALAAGLLEWRRHVQAESVAFIAFGYGAFASLVALPFALWYYVPFLGVITLVVMLLLIYRLAVRSEARHAPKAGHA